MDKLVVATANQKKFQEIKQILNGLSLDLKSLLDFKEHPQIVEDGNSFYQNALKKAKVVSVFYGCPALGEDSGLEVLALDGQPGIYSARFAGPDADDQKNIQKLLAMMRDLPFEERRARFVSYAVLVLPGEKIEKFQGSLEGFITDAPKGSSGFGYDPVFYLSEQNKTVAQIPISLKNKISHRYKAINLLKNYLLKNKAAI